MDPDVALPAGIYRHYKGPLYLVLGLAHDANADDLFWFDDDAQDFDRFTDREVVVYVGLQLDEAHTGARLAVRTLQDFVARVCHVKNCGGYGRECHPESYCEHSGHTGARFSYVGPRYEIGMESR